MDITLERILSLIPSEKDGRFKKYAAADFASKIGVAQNLPSEWKAGSKYSRQLEKDLHYERKSKFRVWIAFLVLVAINIAMLLFDLFNPYVGYIRYQRKMAAYTGETVSVVLGTILRKIKAATRL